MHSKIIKKLNYKQITNGSHFGHFLNIYIYKLKIKIKIKEISIEWKNGNIKSHLNGYTYVIILFLSLIKYFFTGSFFKEKNNRFNFKKINI